jgi:hypothetical protein
MRRLLLFLLLLAGCATGPGPDMEPSRHAGLDEEFTLAMGESILLDGTPYTVLFQQLLEDSRCAKGVICVWEGNARIVLEFLDLPGASPSRPADVTGFKLELNTSPRFPTEKYDTGFIIELRRLEPLPGEGVQPLPYKATLIARKT